MRQLFEGLALGFVSTIIGMVVGIPLGLLIYKAWTLL